VWFVLAAAGCTTQRITLPLLPPLVQAPSVPTVWSESFDALDPARWREVEVRGHTEFQAVELEGRRCLRARSQSSASILLSEGRVDPDAVEWLSWEWRVDRLAEREALARKDGSDAAARVYVYFDTGLTPWQKRSLDYVWSAHLPVGTVLDSAYSANSKIIVAESGTASLGRWRTVVRNLEDDYERCFGDDDPPPVIAIGLMSDSDSTKDETLAYFDEIRVSRVKPATAAGTDP
jgi:hypothetical protein